MRILHFSPFPMPKSRLCIAWRTRTQLWEGVAFDMYFCSRNAVAVSICILPIGLDFEASKSGDEVHFDMYFWGRTARSSWICKFPRRLDFRASDETDREWVRIHGKKSGRKTPEGARRGDEVDFDMHLHDRNDGSSWICKFTREIDVAVRYVIYQSKWTWRRPKTPQRAIKVTFESVFHARTATSSSICKFQCKLDFAASGQTEREWVRIRTPKKGPRMAEWTKRGEDVDFDLYFCGRDARWSLICIFVRYSWCS